ncbi:MAG: hypothetical protein LC772_04695, partial [Chloroflexi bacterium]|nr:hypothetical protein [Chloroflexota bacterium]
MIAADAGVRRSRTWRRRVSEVLIGAAPWSETVRKDALGGALTGVYTGVLGPFLALVAAKSLHTPVLLLALMMSAPFIGNMATPLWVHRLHGRPKLPFAVVPALAARSLYLLMALVR